MNVRNLTLDEMMDRGAGFPGDPTFDQALADIIVTHIKNKFGNIKNYFKTFS